MDHRRGCGGDASVNVDAVVGDDHKDNGGDGNDGDGGGDLALALTHTRRPMPQRHLVGSN